MPHLSRPSRTAIALLGGFMALAIVPAAAPAQTVTDLQRQGLQPVEHEVGDTDPLRKSTRILAPGIGPSGQESVVYRRTNSPDDRLYLVTPFYIASYRRSEYTKIETRQGDTGTAMIVPPDTVFHVGLPKRPYNEQNPAPNDDGNPARVTNRIEPSAVAAPPVDIESPDEWAIAEHRKWKVYLRANQAHERDVLAALDRVLDSAE